MSFPTISSKIGYSKEAVNTQKCDRKEIDIRIQKLEDWTRRISDAMSQMDASYYSIVPPLQAIPIEEDQLPSSERPPF